MEPAMPRYYFNVRQDKVLLKDEEGEELANLDAAREEAVASAREILSEAALGGNAGESSSEIEVTDATGKTVLTVPIGRVTGTETQS
jgi:hypothetical protein